MSPVIQIALPVFAVIAAGFAVGRLGLATSTDAAALNKFVFRFAMPAALFNLMAGAAALSRADMLLAASYGATALCVMAAAYFVGLRIFRLSPPEAGAHAFASAVGNAVFLGLPIALAVEGWARPYVVLMLVEGIVVIGAGAALMAQETSAASRSGAALGRFIARPFRNPLVMAAIAGYAFSMSGLDFSGPVREFFAILGRAAGPVALFSIGLFLATHAAANPASMLGKISAIFAAKMIVLPLLTLGAFGIMGIDDATYWGALALFTAVPTAVGAYVMASQYGRYVQEIAAAIALTTLLSVLTISGALFLFAPKL